MLKRIPFALLLVLCCLFSHAEEVNKVELFLDLLPDKGVRALREFEKATKDKDTFLAARLYQSLLSNYPDTLVEGENGLHLPLRQRLDTEFNSLGAEGVRAFREQFDPAASLFRQGFIAGDVSQALALIKAYPFSSYAPEAMLVLASHNADSRKFHLAISFLEELFDKFPQTKLDNPAAIALLARCYADLNNRVRLDALHLELQKTELGKSSFAGGQLADYVASLKQRLRPAEKIEWDYPAGDPAGSRIPDTTVRTPVLLWSAPLVPKPIEAGSAIEESYRPLITTANSHNNLSVRPVLRNGKVFVSDGLYVYSRDLATGFFLNQYPVGRNLEVTAPSPAVDASSGILSLSIAEGKVFSTFQSSSNVSYLSPMQIEGYQESDATPIIDALKIRFSKDLSEQQSSLLSAMSFVSVPIVYGGQVFAVGEVRSGMVDAYALSFDANSGALLWMTRLFTYASPQGYSRNRPIAVPSIAEGTVYVSLSGGIIALSAANGQVKWLNGYEMSSTPSGPVEPPCVLTEYDAVIVSTHDAVNTHCYSATTGKLMWKLEGPMKGLYIGRQADRIYFQRLNRISGINVTSGQQDCSFMLPYAIFGAYGTVTKQGISIIFEGNYIIHDAITGEVKSSHQFTRAKDGYYGRIFPHGDSIVCVSPEMVFCFVDGDSVRRDLNAMRQADPADPVPYLRAGLLAAYAEDDETAMREFKAALEYAKPDSLFMNYRVTDLVRSYITAFYRKVADKGEITEPNKILESAEIGLKYATLQSDKRFLNEIRAAALLNMRDFEKAFEVLQTLASLEDAKTVKPYDRLVTAATQTELVKSSGASYRTLRNLCIESIESIAQIYPKIADKYEVVADILASKARAGDIEAASEVFVKYFFTDVASDLACYIARQVFDGKLDQVDRDRLIQTTARFRADLSPSLAMARAVLLLDKKPAAAAKTIYDIGRHFADSQIQLDAGEITLAELSKKYIDIKLFEPPAPPDSDFSSGLARAWQVDLNRPRNYRYVYTPFVSDAGILTPSQSDNSLTLFDKATGKMLWCLQPPRRSFIGVSLQDSESPKGALIVQIIAGFPAEAAGLQAGDVITEFNGIVAETHAKLIDAIASVEPGVPTTLKILRRGEELVVAIVPAERTGEHVIADQVIGIYSYEPQSVVVLRRSLASTSFYFEKILLADGKVEWRKSFDRIGYPSAPSRFGDMLLFYCTSYDRFGTSSLISFDLRSGDGEVLSLDHRNFYGNLYAISGGRIVMMESSGSSTYLVYDLFSGERLFSYPSPSGSFQGGFFDRYLAVKGKQGVASLDIYSGLESGKERNGYCLLAGKDQFIFRSNQGIGLDIVAARDPSFLLDFIPTGLQTMSARMLYDGKEMTLQSNEFRFIRNSNNYSFSQLSRFDVNGGKMLWMTAMPYGSYLREMEEQRGNIIVSLHGQQVNYNGIVIVSSKTGATVFRTMTEQNANIRAVIDSDMLLIDDGDRLIAYRPITEQDKTALAKVAAEAMNDLPQEPSMLRDLLLDLLNARMYDQLIALCDHIHGLGRDDLSSDFIDGIRGFAREHLAEKKILHNAVTGTVTVDGDLSDWPDAPWFDLPDTPASLFDNWTAPTSKADLSARCRFAADDNNLYIAVEVRDDKIVLDAHEGVGFANADAIEVVIGGGSFTGDYPCDGAVLLKMSPNPETSDFTYTVVAGRGVTSTIPPTTQNERNAIIKGAFRRDDANGLITYEFSIPAMLVSRTQQYGNFDPTDPKVLFNILVTDRDDNDPRSPVKALEAAPTFSPHIYSVLRMSLFPRISIPKELKGWR